MSKLVNGQTYHIDIEFEGERLVDDVKIIFDIIPRSWYIVVYSPKLLSNISIKKKDLKDVI
jgi:hypothetical protein